MGVVAFGVVAAEPHAGSAGRRLQVHLAPGQYERWQEAAKSSGASLSEFVRSSVEERIAEPRGRSRERLAHAVSADLLPEIERMLMERLPGASPEPVGASLPPPLPTAHVPSGLLRAWDPSCYSADLHRNATVCTECGGSFAGRR